MPIKISPRALYPDLLEAGDDEQTQHIVEELHSLHNGPAASPQLYASIERAVAQRAAQRNQPRRLFTLPEWINLRPALAIAMVLVLLGGVGLKSIQARPLGPQEILRRASRLVMSPEHQGLPNLHIVKEWVSPEGKVFERTELWYQAPDKLKVTRQVDVYQVDLTNNVTPYFSTLIANGQESWSWLGRTAQNAQLTETRDAAPAFRWLQPELMDLQLTPASFVLEPGLTSTPSKIMRRFDIVALPDEVVQGRPAHVLELRRKPGADAILRAEGISVPDRVWIDKELLITLQAQYGDAKDVAITRLHTLEINPDVAAAGVSFTPLEGVNYVEASIFEKDSQWQKAAQSQSFTIFRPAYRPSHFAGFIVHSYPRSYVQSRFGRWDNTRFAKGADEYGAQITLTQRSAAKSRPLTELEGETMFVGGYAAKYLYRVIRDEARHELTFDRDGTRISIFADDPFDVAELFVMAESLQPVAK